VQYSKHLYTEVQIKLCTTLVLLLCESECCMMRVVASPRVLQTGFESKRKRLGNVLHLWTGTH